MTNVPGYTDNRQRSLVDSSDEGIDNTDNAYDTCYSDQEELRNGERGNRVQFSDVILTRSDQEGDLGNEDQIMNETDPGYEEIGEHGEKSEKPKKMEEMAEVVEYLQKEKEINLVGGVDRKDGWSE